MLLNELIITIPGDPATKGSLKCVGRRGNRAHVLVEQLETSGPWRNTVAGWIKAKVTTQADTGQPLGAEVTFTLRRPPSHYGTGRNRHIVKDSAPKHPVGHNTGDVDKLLRLILDALQDTPLLPDDCAVVEVTARKAYLTDKPASVLLGRWAQLTDVLPNPGVRIRLYPI